MSLLCICIYSTLGQYLQTSLTVPRLGQWTQMDWHTSVPRGKLEIITTLLHSSLFMSFKFFC